jgi:hypothetical protein
MPQKWGWQFGGEAADFPNRITATLEKPDQGRIA